MIEEMRGNVMDLQGEGWKVLAGSCLDRLPELADESVDAVVCDPPYELGFMGKSWDSSGIAYDVNVWRECLRVLKPGGHVLAFGGSRTWHRLAVAIEDAGFELRDSIAWLYGSGFPKSLDVSKAIDKAAGAEREVIGEKISPDGIPYASRRVNASGPSVGGNAFGDYGNGGDLLSAPATDAAKQWAGWGTALKPAFEPVVVGRKPLKGTVAANVLAYGVGGLNIDGTRIGTDGGAKYQGESEHTKSEPAALSKYASSLPVPGLGRWPSNVILDEYTAQLVDQQSGESKSPNKPVTQGGKEFGMGGERGRMRDGLGVGYGDSGGASRFFYIAKANKRDRNEGLDEHSDKSAAAMVDRVDGSAGMSYAGAGAGRVSGAKNFHPTVKPTELMRQLIRLVTPPNGVVLDPFTGSGSTGKAAILEGMQFIGCELTEDYLPIIEGRIEWAVEQVKADKLKVEQEQAEVLF